MKNSNQYEVRAKKEQMQECGSVSMESVMDTVTRVLASVAVLGAIFALLVKAYSGIGSKVEKVQASGDKAVDKVVNYISNVSFSYENINANVTTANNSSK